MAPEAFGWHASNSCAFPTPPSLGLRSDLAPTVFRREDTTENLVCQCQSSFDILAFLLPFHSTSWDLVSDFPSMTDNGTAWCSPCLKPCHGLDTFVRSDPTQCRTYFHAQPPLHDQPPHQWVHVCTRCVGAPSQHGLNWLPTISSNSSHSCVAAHFFLQTILACFKSIFFTSCGTPPPAPSNSKVCHCGHWIQRSRLSHKTAPAKPLACCHR